MTKNSKKEKIKEDLRMGKQFDVLAYKYDSKSSYIKNIYYEMKKDGEELMDRTSEEWIRLQVKLKPDIDRNKITLGKSKFR